MSQSISLDDVKDAEAFLTTFMQEKIPEASFEVGSAVRDFLVTGFAALYSYLRGEIDKVAARQSLLRIKEQMEVDSDAAQVVDEILSNWFIQRKSGHYAQGLGRLHFTQRMAVSLPSTARFWKGTSLQFVIDTDAPVYIISESQLLPLYDSTGRITEYVVDIPMRALHVGTQYNIPAGLFTQYAIPGGIPFFSYAECPEGFTGGSGVEDTEALLRRAETAISVRNLVNTRSCDVTLQTQFPEIQRTFTVGMGDAEVVRDLLKFRYPHLNVHTGGMYDTYIDIPHNIREANLTIGGFFTRADAKSLMFRDPELTYDLARDFVTLGILVGHVIFVHSGLKGVPRGYVITEVTPHTLYVAESVPFIQASDELDTNEVVYSIGWIAPTFSNVELTPGTFLRQATSSSLYPTVPVGTSRKVQNPGQVFLVGSPILDIIHVAITNPPSGLSSYIDKVTNTIVFPNRVNWDPIIQADPLALQYSLQVVNPEYAQSDRAINVLKVGFKSDPTIFDGFNLRVIYRTGGQYKAISNYVTSRNVRITAADHLIKMRNPVWVGCHIRYKLKRTVVGSLSEAEIKDKVSEYINQADKEDELDVSDLTAFIRACDSRIGTIYPMVVYYTLHSPDGQLLEYMTTDVVTISPTKANGAVLLNGATVKPTSEMQQLGITSIRDTVELQNYLSSRGITDLTVMYLTANSYITMELV